MVMIISISNKIAECIDDGRSTRYEIFESSGTDYFKMRSLTDGRVYEVEECSKGSSTCPKVEWCARIRRADCPIKSIVEAVPRIECKRMVIESLTQADLDQLVYKLPESERAGASSRGPASLSYIKDLAGRMTSADATALSRPGGHITMLYLNFIRSLSGKPPITEDDLARGVR